MTKEEIIAIRKSLNLSQTELAEKLNVGVKTIIKYEKGIAIPRSKIILINNLDKPFKINPENLTKPILELNAQVDLLNAILERHGHISRRWLEKLRTKKIEELRIIITKIKL